MKKVILENVRIITVAIILSLGASVAFAWTGPTATPPSSNISAPVNVGSTSQIKTGGLWVNSLGIDAGLTVGGKLGIGVTSPTEKLEVNGNIKLPNGVGAYGAGRVQTFSPGDLIGLTLNSTSRVWDLISIISSNPDYFAIRDNTAGVNRLLIDENGNVGIGITPTQELDVNGKVNAASLAGAGGYISTGSYGGTGLAAYFPEGIWSNGASAWIYGAINTNGAITDTSSRMKLDPAGLSWFSGNVGIGTTNPTSKLSVNGNIDVANNRITSVAAPINSSDVATKGYVDALSTSPAGWNCAIRTATSAAGSAIATASCLTTEKVISGGCNYPGSSPEKRSEYPTNQGWACVSQYSPSGTPSSITAYANCCK